MKKFSLKKYRSGWLPSPKDRRDYIYSSVQPLEAIPVSYKDEAMIGHLLKYVHNQGWQPSCVAESGSKIQVYQEQKEEQLDKDFSVRFLYSLAKKLDGCNNTDGTYLRTMAKIMVNQGAPIEEVYPTNYSLSKDEFKDWTKIPQETFSRALPYKDKSYAVIFPSYTNKENSFQQMKQAIYRNGIAMAGFWGDNQGWQQAHIKPPLHNDWGHAVPLIYYDENYIYFLNSWGKNWGNNGIGYFDKNYLPSEVWTFIDEINFNKTMRLVKTKTSGTVYLLNDVLKTAKPIFSGTDYLSLTGDNDWKMVEEITEKELANYKIEKRILVFER